DDAEVVANSGREAIDEGQVERRAAERDRAGDGELVIAIHAGAGATELDREVRAGAETRIAGMKNAGAGAGSERTAAVDCDRADRASAAERAGIHRGAARIGIDGIEQKRAGAVDREADVALGVARWTAVAGGGGGARVVADHAGDRLGAGRT